MKNFTAAFAIICGVLFVYGFMAEAGKDRITVTTRDERKLSTITVTLFDINEDYRWITVYACSAERGEESPQAFCNYFWERESTQETRVDQVQYPFEKWRVPGGLILITAVAFDKYNKPLARKELQWQHGL
jgi:hypothetical protein